MSAQDRVLPRSWVRRRPSRGACLSAAQSAQRVATPVLRTAGEKSAETLSHAAERAAVVLADVGERLAESGEERAGKLQSPRENGLRMPRRHWRRRCGRRGVAVSAGSW